MTRFANFDPDRFVSEPAAIAPPVAAPTGMPRDWVIGLARLAEMSPPKGANGARWQQIVDDAEAFALGWHDEAVRFGWTIGDVFGLGEFSTGLVIAIRGARVTSMQAAFAIIADSDRRRAHYRRPAELAEPLWQMKALV